MTAFVAVGSNLGDRCAHLRFALRELSAAAGVHCVRPSPVYESVAVGPGEQPDYLNAVLELKTTLAPDALLDLLQSIEHAAGRVRTQRWGARTLDLDLLLHGDTRQQLARLTLPHPRLATRNFVVFPLCDLVPELRLPDGTALAELRERLPADGLRPAGTMPCAEAGHA